MTLATDPAHVAERYLAAWNETDATARRALIEAGWTAAATYVDPLMAAEGHEAIDGLIAAVHQRFPGHRFSLLGAADGHGDRVRFSWALSADGAEPIVGGTDFAVVEPDGRLASVTGFLDKVPG